VASEPESPPSAPPSELRHRIVSGIVLAALAIATAVLGGTLFVMFWAAAALVIFWEWSRIVAGGAAAVTAAGAVALALAAVAAWAGAFGAALAILAAGALIVALLCAAQRTWGAAGVLYAGSVLLGPLLLRRDQGLGLVAILFLFAVVWATDTFGYFVGRAVGGPKLAARISPKKTWSGACGGALGAVLAGLAVIGVAGEGALVPAAAIALVLSIVSQGGDLFESFVKRRFGVKDAGHAIPGHGGLMDRLDGFLVAAGVAALVGLARGGPDAPAGGLLVW
jgi:phosphatidate cytidylyltransferase